MRNRFLGEGFVPDSHYDPQAGPSAQLAGLSSELDALAAYVASLDESSVPRSPYREPETGAMTPAAIRGREHFIELNCMSCHDSSQLTASGGVGTLKDIGSMNGLSGSRLGQNLSGIDIPTLMGLHATERYGHLGISEDLASSLTRGGGRDMPIDAIMVANANDLAKADPHRQIPPEQLDDIIAFLQQADGSDNAMPVPTAPDPCSCTCSYPIIATGPLKKSKKHRLTWKCRLILSASFPIFWGSSSVG